MDKKLFSIPNSYVPYHHHHHMQMKTEGKKTNINNWYMYSNKSTSWQTLTWYYERITKQTENQIYNINKNKKKSPETVTTALSILWAEANVDGIVIIIMQ